MVSDLDWTQDSDQAQQILIKSEIDKLESFVCDAKCDLEREQTEIAHVLSANVNFDADLGLKDAFDWEHECEALKDLIVPHDFDFDSENERDREGYEKWKAALEYDPEQELKDAFDREYEYEALKDAIVPHDFDFDSENE